MPDEITGPAWRGTQRRKKPSPAHKRSLGLMGASPGKMRLDSLQVEKLKPPGAEPMKAADEAAGLKCAIGKSLREL